MGGFAGSTELKRRFISSVRAFICTQSLFMESLCVTKGMICDQKAVSTLSASSRNHTEDFPGTLNDG